MNFSMLDSSLDRRSKEPQRPMEAITPRPEAEAAAAPVYRAVHLLRFDLGGANDLSDLSVSSAISVAKSALEPASDVPRKTAPDSTGAKV
jgi:hypothetical protein